MQKLLERFTKEQLIERLKHRISVAEKYPDLEEAQYDEAIFKIALAAIQDGWVVAPTKADLNMIKAGADAATEGFLIPGVYEAMIKASPKPE